MQPDQVRHNFRPPHGVVLRGQVKSEDNKPMQDVSVVASLVPAEKELASYEGEALNRHSIGQSVTSNNGSFTLQQDMQSVPAQYKEEDGSVTVNLTFARPDGEDGQGEWLGGYSVSLYPPANGQGLWRASTDTRGGERAKISHSMALKFVMDESSTLVADETAEGIQEVEAALSAETLDPNNAAPAEKGELQENQSTSCSEAWQANYHNVPVILLSAGSNSSWVEVDYEFSANDSQTMGVGYSASGAWGSFSASGTRTTSSNLTINWPARTAASGSDHVYYRSEAKYSKYKEVCHFIAGGSWFTVTTYIVRPRYVEGDQIWTGQSNTYPTQCTSILPGGSVTRQTGSTTSFTNGVDISSKIGIDLKLTNTLAGGSSHKVTFKNIASTTTKWVCGKYRVIGSTGYTGTLMGDHVNR